MRPPLSREWLAGFCRLATFDTCIRPHTWVDIDRELHVVIPCETFAALQEVVGSDESALQAVVAADVELLELKEEEAEILERQEANGDAEANGADEQNDVDSDRLNEIYERMQASCFLDISRAGKTSASAIGQGR